MLFRSHGITQPLCYQRSVEIRHFHQFPRAGIVMRFLSLVEVDAIGDSFSTSCRQREKKGQTALYELVPCASPWNALS